MSDTTGAPQVVHDLWFDDGNVIFQADDKLFRLHWGILSARSTIFSDMFSVPQPVKDNVNHTTSTDNGASIPKIYLPDRGVDVYPFFRAIFDSSFFEGPPSAPSLESIISILRLSAKYEVLYLKSRSLSHLNALFPIERNTWAESIRTIHPKFGLTEVQNRIRMLDLIEAAHQVDARWIIPAIFLLSVNIPLTDIFAHDSWQKMSRNEQERYLSSRERYKDTERLDPTGWTQSTARDPCKTSSTCVQAERRIHGFMFHLWYFPQIQPDGMFWNLFKDEKLCQPCAAAAKAEATLILDERWNKCPKLLGLGTWDDLKKERDDALSDV